MLEKCLSYISCTGAKVELMLYLLYSRDRMREACFPVQLCTIGKPCADEKVVTSLRSNQTSCLFSFYFWLNNNMLTQLKTSEGKDVMPFHSVHMVHMVLFSSLMPAADHMLQVPSLSPRFQQMFKILKK